VTTTAASGADPVGDAIGGEGIMIPVQVSLFGTAAGNVAIHVGAHPTIPDLAPLDLTAVDAKVTALLTFFSRRLRRQIERFSALSVNRQNMGINLFEMLTDAA